MYINLIIYILKMKKLPIISNEAMEFIRKRLPLELKNIIYSYIDIETRINILLENKQNLIYDLWKIPESILLKLFNVCITDKILVNLGSTGIYNSIVYGLTDPYLTFPTCNYKSNGITHHIRHPVEQEVINVSALFDLPIQSSRSHNNPNIVDYRRVRYIIDCIANVINTYSSIYTKVNCNGKINEKKLSTFDYAIRKRLFNFIHCIHKRIYYYKKLATEEAHTLLISKCERIHRRVFKRRILKVLVKKALVMCVKREKKERKEAAFKAKLAKKEATVKAKLVKKEAAVKAKLVKTKTVVRTKL
jgi:hypothetical protein